MVQCIIFDLSRDGRLSARSNWRRSSVQGAWEDFDAFGDSTDWKTLAPLRAARRMGYQVGVLRAAQSGLSLYRQLGFRECCRLGVYVMKVAKMEMCIGREVLV
jgi:hypothetical protein